MAAGAVLLSLTLCVLWWHDAWFGALFDVVILGGLVVAWMQVAHAKGA